jgi:hypothetical protein
LLGPRWPQSFLCLAGYRCFNLSEIVGTSIILAVTIGLAKESRIFEPMWEFVTKRKQAGEKEKVLRKN